MKVWQTARLAGWPGLSAILLIYLLLAFAFSQVTPFNKGPDEGINLAYINFIIANGRLPVTYAERDQVGPKANWPALYHLGVAGLSQILKVDVTTPPVIKKYWDSFRYQAIDIQDDNPGYLLTEDQLWPYVGQILALHLGRWLSVAFSTVTLGLVYLALIEMRPDRPGLALAGTAMLAFLPAFIFVGSVLNEDALVAMLAALYFWLLIRAVKQPEWWWPFGLLGLVLGLSVTAKYTTIVLPLEIGLILVVMVRQGGLGWSWYGLRLALVGGTAVLASAWWFGWNFWYLNEIEELGLVAGLLRPIFTGGTDVTLARLGNFLSGGQIGLTELPENIKVGTFPAWLQTTFFSFWGVSIGDFIPFFPYAYIIIGFIVCLASVGLWRLWRTDPASRQWLLLLVFHISLFVILPLIRFGLSRRLGQTAQGRHILIPAAAAVMGLIVWGLAAAIPARWQRWFFTGLMVGLVVWTGAHLYRLATFAPPPLPLRTLSQAAEWLARPLGAKFGEAVELVSYELDPQPRQGRLNLTLAWRSLAQVNQNYLLQVILADSTGQAVTHWLGYPAQGRLPTLAWESGDAVFDRLALPLPALPAGDYQLTLQLGAGPDSQPLGEAVTLPVRLDTPTMAVLPTSVDYALWQASIPPASYLQSLISPLPAPNLHHSQNPVFRYPATISVLSPGPVRLLDPSGQPYSPTRSQANIHHFVVGPRWLSGDYRLQVEDKAATEPVLTVENWWPRRFERPAGIEAPAQVNFANQLNFLGYSLPQKQVKAGQAFPLTLYWQSLPAMSPQADFVQFNHLLDSQGHLHGGYDRRPLEYYSTLFWAPGEVVVDGYAVPVNADAPPGQYYLNVGYYLIVGESAVNLPLVMDGQMSGVTSVTIGPIEVVKP